MDDEKLHTRRTALKCLGFGGAGTLFALAGGVLTPIDLAMAASDDALRRAALKPLFVQISDSHIGFSKSVSAVALFFDEFLHLASQVLPQRWVTLRMGGSFHPACAGASKAIPSQKAG